MQSSNRRIAIVLLTVNALASPLTFGPFVVAQETRERRATTEKEEKTQRNWPTDNGSVVKKATESDESKLVSEPVIRIGLSTGTRTVTISTTAQLLNASELNSAPQPLETARVRIESRLLSPQRPSNDRPYEVELARSVSREDADRLIESVQSTTGEVPQAVADSSGKFRVIIVKQSGEEAEAVSAKLEDAGFEVVTSFKTPVEENNGGSAVDGNQSTSASKDAPKSANKLKLTSRSSVPTRELLAFARGASPVLRSSAPLVFASSTGAAAPVRFNDKPYRGKIEVFANTRGALTVVNVIGLEDYVRGVVPNELSPGGYPAIEALKAQAIAARTYALRNRGQFSSEGYDLLPTTRSQVYRGLSSEHPLSSRAVEETRGIVATYNGEPINALYTSTCGGRTENSENIFNDAVPYLRGRECAAEGKAAFAPFTIKSSRDLFELKDEKDLTIARDVALLAVNGVSVPTDRVSSAWLSAHANESEVREWLSSTARLSRNGSFKPPDDATKPPAFSTALLLAVFGDKRADTLLNNADVDYVLGLREAEQIPESNRADVAMLLRDGHLSLFADATLRPKETMSRGRVLHAISSLLEARGLLAIQKGTARPAVSGSLILRSSKGKDQPIAVGRDAFLFRDFGENTYQVKSLALVGGEPATFHVGAKGEVDYLEVRPAPNGASAERFSPFTNWTTELSVGEVQARLGRSVRGVGSISDLRIARRGSSRRVIDLEVIGSQGVGHVRGGRIRSALGLREQLFVIDRLYGESGRVIGFVFTGRGWGHGVGMCQVGAYGLARQGFSVEQILKAYYTGIELTKLYN
ncbi:MAG TPA: SpoIID/LytB domain-containing protein [Pyrinomonadaceae bacterium]|nr:SpoIID/LytB domain-containing protein [Pyrinomonadaceae bacterium]